MIKKEEAISLCKAPPPIRKGESMKEKKDNIRESMGFMAQRDFEENIRAFFESYIHIRTVTERLMAHGQNLIITWTSSPLINKTEQLENSIRLIGQITDDYNNTEDKKRISEVITLLNKL